MESIFTRTSFFIKLSGLTARIDHRYPGIEAFYKGFLTEEKENCQFCVSVTEEKIQSLYGGTMAAREETCIRMELLRHLLSNGRILLHGVAVVLDGQAYLFLGRSGMGKTTHAVQWLETFGDRAYILSGDKPLLSFSSDTPGNLMVHGTPWNGKEGWGRNDSAPVAGICFLERGKENRIRPLSQNEMLGMLLQLVIVPRREPEFSSFMQIADRIAREIPSYLMHCDISHEAARIACEGMKRKDQWRDR